MQSTMPRARPLTSLQGHAIRYDLDALDEDAHVPVNSTSFMGTMTYPCVHCDALKFHAELDTNSCCLNGQLAVLPVLPLPPLRLQQLFFGNSPRAVFFREHIRLFNSAMAQVWASVKSNWAVAYLPSVFTAPLTISWALLLGAPMPSPHAMLYFYDKYEATRIQRIQFLAAACFLVVASICIASGPFSNHTEDARRALPDCSLDWLQFHLPALSTHSLWPVNGRGKCVVLSVALGSAGAQRSGCSALSTCA